MNRKILCLRSINMYSKYFMLIEVIIYWNMRFRLILLFIIKEDLCLLLHKKGTDQCCKHKNCINNGYINWESSWMSLRCRQIFYDITCLNFDKHDIHHMIARGANYCDSLSSVKKQGCQSALKQFFMWGYFHRQTMGQKN